LNKQFNIRPKERDTILQSLRAGVVPRFGLQHIQVGRADEVQALIHDIDRINDGGSSIRFIIGEYGAGKTFFLHLVRSIAHEKGLLSLHGDLSPDRRIHASGGQARNLYSELMKNLSSRSKPDGNALQSVVEKFVSTALSESKQNAKPVENIIQEKLQQLCELVGGYDFAEVIALYWKGYYTGNEQLKSDVIRWMHGEFLTKTDVRAALGIRTIIDDTNVYDHLKLFALFCKLAGYGGVLVAFDEMVNIYKLANAQARNSNYEQILRILNDCLQGNTSGIGFVFCGTPDFLMDPRRGLYSYQALQSRLAENAFAKVAGVNDYSGPVIRLSNLTPEDLYVLLDKIRKIFAGSDQSQYTFPENAIKAFMQHCSKKIGDAYFKTPRTTIRSFIDLLSILQQNEKLDLSNLIEGVEISADVIPDNVEIIEDLDITSNENELASFKL
jgi:hypothetical protein